MSENKIAVVTGASRGLGFMTAKALARLGFEVVFAVRTTKMFEGSLKKLQDEGLQVHAFELDLSSDASIKAFASQMAKKFPVIQVLVNNAGIFIDEEHGSQSEKLLKTFRTNTMGPFLLTQLLWPHLAQARSARVVNVSSGMGQLSEMGAGSPAYRISKTALNAVTKIFSQQGSGRVLVNSVCPGWVKTDMGGRNAPRSLEEGAAGIVWAATLPDDGPNGLFFRDGQKLEW